MYGSIGVFLSTPFFPPEGYEAAYEAEVAMANANKYANRHLSWHSVAPVQLTAQLTVWSSAGYFRRPEMFYFLHPPLHLGDFLNFAVFKLSVVVSHFSSSLLYRHNGWNQKEYVPRYRSAARTYPLHRRDFKQRDDEAACEYQAKGVRDEEEELQARKEGCYVEEQYVGMHGEV